MPGESEAVERYQQISIDIMIIANRAFVCITNGA